MLIGNPVGGIAKTDALNVPGKYYMFCGLLHIFMVAYYLFTVVFAACDRLPASRQY
jgi:hypothetical protein